MTLAAVASRLAFLREVDYRRLVRGAIGLAAVGALAAFVGLTVPVFGWLSVVAFVSLGLVGVVLFDFRIGVVALMVLYPLSTAKMLPSYSGINPLNLALLGTTLSYLLHRFGRRIDYRLVDRKLVLLYLLPFVLSGIYGALKAPSLSALLTTGFPPPEPGAFFITWVVKPSLMIIMALLVAAAIRESREPRRFLYPFVAAAVLPAVLVTLYLLLSRVGLSDLVRFRTFLSVLGLHANQFAVVLNFGIACLVFTALASPGTRFRILLLSFAGFLALALAITFSRGGYLGFSVLLMAYFFYYRRWRNLLVGLVVLAVGLSLVPQAMVDRVTLGVTHGARDEMSSGRLEGIWAPLAPKVLESPLVGHGAAYVGRSDLVSSRRMMPVAQAHNAYLDLLLDTGVVGFVMVLAFYMSMFRQHRGLAVTDPDPVLRGFFRGASVGVLGLLLQACFDDRLVPNLPQLLMWIAYGFMLGRRPDMALPRSFSGPADGLSPSGGRSWRVREPIPGSEPMR